jgi:anaerobic selenocysteine-containing dehydrogenase
MTKNKDNTGIHALVVIGDLPVEAGMEKPDLLVQCNMFRTGLTEMADVFLPVTDFLENEGHLLSMDGRMKKVNRAATAPGLAKSIPWIIAGLSKAVGMEGLETSTAALYREIKGILDTLPSGRKDKPEPSGSGWAAPSYAGDASGGNGLPVDLVLGYDYFTYRGNRLTDMINELGTIAGKGKVGLAASVMEQLKIGDGERVRITSGKGGMDAEARAVPGMPPATALLFCDGTDTIHITDGDPPGTRVVNVKIEKL